MIYSARPLLKFYQQRRLIWISCFLLLAPFGHASQSSINQRTTYNSEKQLSTTIGGTWDLVEPLFAVGDFTFSRTPIEQLNRNDTFYQASIGGGYSRGDVTLDFIFSASDTPGPKITSVGYTIGLTYAFSREKPRSIEEERRHGNRRKESPWRDQERESLFWTRITYGGTALKSSLYGTGENKGNQLITTVDVFFPATETIILGVGTSFFNYEDPNGFFSNALRNNNNAEQNLLGATLQGLPKFGLNVSFAWQIAEHYQFVPRYQATEMESSRQWSHTIDVGWRYDFLRYWSVTPGYETSVHGDQMVSGVMLDVTYRL